MNKTRIMGGQALMRSLLEQGVDTIFGYPGGQIINVFDNMYDYRDRLRHILTRHEQGAVHAAQGYARATGKVGVCIVTSGPGATNLMTGIADAMLDSTPIVCITGQVPSTLLGTDAFQEADIISMSMPISKWNFQVTQASEVAGAVAKAFYIASTGRPGPVLIDITKDAQIGLTDFEYRPCVSLRSYKPQPKMDMADIAKAVELINCSQRPLILVGQGVKLSGAEKELVELAQIGNIPMASTLMGISAVSTSDPLFVGNLGMHGNISSNLMTQESDLLIGVGLRFSDRVTGAVKEYAPQAKIIHIDIDAAELGKNLRVDVPILADARQALEAMKTGLKHIERAEWFARKSELQAEDYDKIASKIEDPKGQEITSAQVVRAFAEHDKGNAIVVTDVGQNQMFAALYSRFNTTRSFLTSGGLGTMGFGLPAAIGAKLGMPEREVVLFVGDGGMQMNIQELGTIMQNNIGVKVIVVNNYFLGMVRQWQQLFFDRRYSFTELENPDFSLVAKAYNIPSARIDSPKELAGAIETMMNTPGAYVLEVVVKREDNVFPMMPAGASLSNMIYND